MPKPVMDSSVDMDEALRQVRSDNIPASSAPTTDQMAEALRARDQALPAAVSPLLLKSDKPVEKKKVRLDAIIDYGNAFAEQSHSSLSLMRHRKRPSTLGRLLGRK